MHGNGERIGNRKSRAAEFLRLVPIGDGAEGKVFAFGRGDVFLRGESQPPREMPERAVHEEIVGVRWLREDEDFVPFAKPEEREPRQMPQARRIQRFLW